MLILVNQLEQSSDAETPLIKRPVYPAFNLGRFCFEIIKVLNKYIRLDRLPVDIRVITAVDFQGKFGALLKPGDDLVQFLLVLF